MFNEKEMDALMDRSDLLPTEEKPQIKDEITKMEGVFKRLNEQSE